jgi:hypothetical protein
MKQLTVAQLQEVKQAAENLAEIANLLQNNNNTWHSWEPDLIDALQDMANLLQVLGINGDIEAKHD